MKNFLLVFVFILYSDTTTAQINMLNGALNWQIELQSSSPHSIPLLYNSRSHHFGLFGYSWCSPLDEKIILAESPMRFKACNEALAKYTTHAKGKWIEVRKNGQAYLIFNSFGELKFWFNEKQKYGIEEDEQKIILRSSQGYSVLFKNWDRTVHSLEFHSLTKKSYVARSGLRYSMAKLEEFRTEKLLLKFTYNQFNNLTQIMDKKSKQSLLEVEYNNQQDIVQKLELPKRQSQTFEFQIQKTENLAYQVSTLKFYESNKLMKQTQAHFKFRKNKRGWKLLPSTLPVSALAIKENEL